MRFLALAMAIAAATLATGACGDGGGPASPASEPLRAGTSTTLPAGTLSLAVAAEPQAGARLRILVTVTNASAAPITLEFTSACTSDYEVLDLANRPLATSEQLCAQVVTQRTLAPGASYTDVHEWARGQAGPQLPPGTYRVRGVLHTGVGRTRPAGDAVTSANVVTVTLP